MADMKVRDPALDAIRCIALLCVICVHFFLNTEFYDVIVSGKDMFAMCILRNSFMICVPLFMMLTGYLVQNKEINKDYYIKIGRIIYIYIISSIFCGFFRVFILHDGLSLLGAAANIFSFETAPYSWYIEMYIGMFLLIPFLNILYDGLCTQRQKQALLITFMMLTVLPSMLNIYCIAGMEWWRMPSTATNYFPVVPDWWSNIYPITYFYLGKYLREYSSKLSKKYLLLLILLVNLIGGIFNFYRSHSNTFVWGPWQSYGSFFITLQAVLVFDLCLKVRYENFSTKFLRLLSRISDLSLGAYLTSWIFDQIVYKQFDSLVSTIQQKLTLFPVVVTVVFVCSLGCSYLIDCSYRLGYKRWIRKLGLLPPLTQKGNE